MKIKYFIFLSIFVLSMRLTNCTSTPDEREVSNVQTVLDSLRRVYAPDKRIKLWVSSLTGNNLRLWVEDPKAFKEVKAVLKKRFPVIKADLELLPEENSTQLVSGLINNSVANLRTMPKHNSELATQALLGTPVRVFKKQGEWYLVQTPNRYIAWVDSAALVTLNKQQLAAYKSLKKVVFKPVCGFSYSKPDDQSQTVSDLVMGCLLPVSLSKNGFYKVKYPDGREAWVKQNEVMNFSELTDNIPEGQQLVETATKFLGFPYLWGGTSAKAVDCSGFTSTIYYMNGLLLQRDASQQTQYGKEITTSYRSEKLLPGDLLFYGRPASKTHAERVTHVAMYLGESRFIHASGKVRINSMDSTSPDFIKSYVSRFVRAVRVKGFVDGKGIEKLEENSFYKAISR